MVAGGGGDNERETKAPTRKGQQKKLPTTHHSVPKLDGHALLPEAPPLPEGAPAPLVDHV